VATLVLGWFPRFRRRNIDLAGALKAESGVTAARRESLDALGLSRVPRVCLSFILLAGAVLLLESLQRIRTTSPGFSTSRVVETLVSSLVGRGMMTFSGPSKTFQDELIDRVRALPGVESAAFRPSDAAGLWHITLRRRLPWTATNLHSRSNLQSTTTRSGPAYFATLPVFPSTFGPRIHPCRTPTDRILDRPKYRAFMAHGHYRDQGRVFVVRTGEFAARK